MVRRKQKKRLPALPRRDDINRTLGAALAAEFLVEKRREHEQELKCLDLRPNSDR